MPTQNFDFKIEAGPVGLIYTQEGKLFADCFGGAYKQNAIELAKRWNLAPELERRNRELVEVLEETLQPPFPDDIAMLIRAVGGTSKAAEEAMEMTKAWKRWEEKARATLAKAKGETNA